MKRTTLIHIIFALTIFSASAQQEKEIKADIRHVTVFPDRAQVDQEAQVTLAPGKTILKLASLSSFIDVQSIQVGGTGDFTILSVNHRNNYLQNLEDSPEIKSIRSQIENLQLKVEDEKAAISVLNEKQAFLVANRAILVKETSFTLEQLKSVMDLYTNSMEQVTTSVLKKNRLIKDYEKQISQLQQQISDKQGRHDLPSGEIAVTVSSDKQVTAKLNISYVVSNAGWYPSYDVRVDDIKKPVSIIYKANVFQKTGVPWNNVKLSFSNATPWVSGNVPVMTPWFVDFFNPPPVIARGYASRKKAAAISDTAVAKAEEPAVLEMVAAPPAVEKQTGQTTVTFDVNIPYSIADDGRMQTIEIQNLTSQADYKYVTLPKLSPFAYLTANISDWAKLSLQAGEATLYFENSFVGKSFIDPNQPGDTLSISLGTDNSIIVKREKRTDFTSRKVIGSNRTDTYSYLLTVRNNKSNPVRITLSDQLPVSSNSSITVEPVELSGGTYNSQSGFVRWELEIKPQESRQIILTWSAKYPKDKTVILD